MKPHVERMVIEKQALDEKIVALNKFLPTGIFQMLAKEDQDLLTHQVKLMSAYSSTLGMRIMRATAE